MKNSIANWDTLSDEEKKQATDLLKGQPSLNAATVHPAAKFFEENGWVKIENYIDKNMANLFYHHIQLEAQRLSWFEENSIEVSEDIHGTFNDRQAPGDFSKYGDPLFDTLLSLGTEKICELTGKDLVPTYSYHRLYTMGTELERHKDRPSCEISTTLCVGYDNSNVDASKYPDWDWPMYVGPKDGEKGTDGMPIHMKPGDMLIYRGDAVEHWRDPLWGNNHAQVFLHYNEKDGQYDIPYDGRPLLGMPFMFRSKDALLRSEELDKNNDDKVEEKTDIEKFEKVIY